MPSTNGPSLVDYGTISSAELEGDLVIMRLNWTTELPIETVFTQLEDAMVFAEAGHEPITPASAVRAGYAIIEKRGPFASSCRNWRAKLEADKP
jgi:hypothetical protein